MSVNITDTDVTPMHAVYEEVRRDAEELSVAVTGSELVGLVPLSSILEAAEYYIKKENLQDPNQRSVIVCDEKMKAVTKRNRVTCSEVLGYLKQHMSAI